MFNVKNNKKRFINGMVLFLLVFNLIGIAVIFPNQAKAIPVTDAGSIGSTIAQTVKDAAQWVREGAEKAWENAKAFSYQTAAKAAVQNFLRNLAVETATWVATGDKGNKPLLFTKDWNKYLEDAGDTFTGDFISVMATDWGSTSADKRSEATQEALFELEECERNCDEVVLCKNTCYAEWLVTQDKIDQMPETTSKWSAGGVYDGSGRGSSGLIQFLCEPELDFKLKIMAGISAVKKPPKPKCTISKARKNWDEFLQSENFLQEFDNYWDISNNDIGIALSLFGQEMGGRVDAEKNAKYVREGSNGYLDVTNLAGQILSPASTVKTKVDGTLEDATTVETTEWNAIFANAAMSFAKSLSGQLLDKWIKKGLGGGSDDSDYNWIDQTKTGGSLANKKGEKTIIARERFAKLFEPQTNSDKIYSIISQLTLCPDLSNPGPTECVIDDKFAQAITEELTVQEAIDKGLLRKDIPFGYLADGLEPSYKQGYPYRSLIILRKYRIIPVGWELAALNISKNETGKTFNIQDIINDFNVSDSRFKGLIDPDWVLKSPELYCSMEGFGEKITSSEVAPGIDTNKDGDFEDEDETKSQLIVSRDKYCADEKTCVKEDDKGNCLFYGYCTEEKRLFDFEGTQCEPQFNGCQSFTGLDGKQVSYTKTSLNFEGCDADNAGCISYCTSRSIVGNSWKCVSPGWDLGECTSIACTAFDTNDIDQDGNITETCSIPQGGVECNLEDSKARLTTENAGIALVRNTENDMYLDSSASVCSNKSEGCHEYIRTKPNLGTNLLLNSSFEGYDQNRDGDVEDAGELSYFWDLTGTGVSSASSSYVGKNAWLSGVGGSSLSQIVDTGYSLRERKFVASIYAKGNCASASFRFYADNGGIIYNFGGVDIKSDELALEDNADWKRYSTAYTFPYFVPEFIQNITVQIGNPSTIPDGCSIDGILLEEASGANNAPSSFAEYQIKNSLFLKTAPDYYECEKYVTSVDLADQATCETAGNLWRAKDKICVEGGSLLCENFAFQCTIEDIGCNMYNPTNGDPGIPGVVSTNDYCPAVCNGYDTYKQSSNFFSLEKFPEYIIPANEVKCSAKDEGCSEFTNLNKIEEGGEATEYYTYLRPCKAIDGTCSTFYTWVGSDVSGFQLKAYLLEDADFDGVPDELLDSSVASELAKANNMYGICNASTVITNPNCYEFYSETENVSQVVYKNTKTCSNECNAYRKTKSTIADCGASDNWGVWEELDVDNADGDDDVTTDVDIAYCLYDGLPEESVTCPAAKDRCFEYKGNTSNNVRNIVDSNFEDGISNWGSLDAGVILSLSSESLSRGGHSMKVSSGAINNRFMYPLKSECHSATACVLEEGCECQVAGNNVCSIAEGEDSCVYQSSLIGGRSYMVSFWGKGSGDISVKFSSAAIGDEFATGDISLSSEWREYSIGPVFIHDSWNMESETNPTYAGTDLIATPEEWVREILEFSGFVGDSYLDNIVLKEIRDNLFLIRPDSEVWNIPEVCNQDNDGNFAAQFTLGCKEYTSEIDRNKVYLKSFNHLCSEDVVGCEAMIDTANSNNPIEEIFNPISPSEVVVPADKIVALVNDKNKECGSEEKGCSAYGVAQYKYNQNLTYNTGGADDGRFDDTDNLFKFDAKYVINDPNNYAESLCDITEVGCSEFTTENKGTFYFRDPLAHRAVGSPVTCEYKKVSGNETYGWYIKGTLTGKPNCPLSSTPTGVEFPTASFVSDAKMNWAGECAAEKDSCTEYLDPMSTISFNIVSNGDFSVWTDSTNPPDFWADAVLGMNNYEKTIDLEPRTVYTVIGDAPGAGSRITLFDCNGILTSPDDSMTYDSATDEMYIESSAVGQFSGRFYTNSTFNCKGLKISDTFISSGTSNGIKILKSGLYYYLDNDVNTTACDGSVNYDAGCVLFNKREVGNTGNLLTINYDTDKNNRTIVTPTTCVTDAPECDSNTLIKVKPDRTCGEWLSCDGTSITKDNNGKELVSCTSVGICNALDNDGVCIGHPSNNIENQVVYKNINIEDISNKSGFVKIGIDWGVGSNSVSGYFPFNQMSQTIGKVIISNSGFETMKTNGSPEGWDSGVKSGGTKLVILDNPLSAQKELGQLRAPEGENFLKLGDQYDVISSKLALDESGSSKFYVSAYINTNKLTYGNAQIEILQFDFDGNPTATISVPVMSQLYGIEGWHQVFSEYVPTDNTVKKIQIRLLGSSDATGLMFFDDIKINPVLQIADSTVTPNFTPQTCRAYPKGDSLSCSYVDDAGVRNIGKNGYCLMYDSAPGNPNQCLMWWPVDIVTGDTTYYDDSYAGRSSLFYCLQSGDMDIVFAEARKNTTILKHSEGYSWNQATDSAISNGRCKGYGCLNDGSSAGMTYAEKDAVLCPHGYYKTVSNSGASDYIHCYTVLADRIIRPDGSNVRADGLDWYKYDGDLQSMYSVWTGWESEATHVDNPVRVYDYKTGKLMTLDEFGVRCNKIAQVVDATGTQVAWKYRTSNQSPYILGKDTVDYKYNPVGMSAFVPFGAIVPIDPSDPTTWSTKLQGAPLACNGKACNSIGFCSKSGKLCLALNGITTNPPGAYAPYNAVKFACQNDDTIKDGECVFTSPKFKESTTALNGANLAKRIFAKSFGIWTIKGASYTVEPPLSSLTDWTPPKNRCSGVPPVRPTCGGAGCLLDVGCGTNPVSDSCDYCGIPPQIENVKIDNTNGTKFFTGDAQVRLSFNTRVDDNQGPIVMYAIDWGDGSDDNPSLVLGSGIAIGSRPNVDNPHIFTKIYKYNDLISTFIANPSTTNIRCANEGENLGIGDGITAKDVTCQGSACCAVNIRLKIKDNWGWCNGDDIAGECDDWEYYPGYIVVNKGPVASSILTSGECAPIPGCFNTGQKRCLDATNIQNCTSNKDGCFDWSAPIACDTASSLSSVCASGGGARCQKTCVDDLGCEEVNGAYDTQSVCSSIADPERLYRCVRQPSGCLARVLQGPSTCADTTSDPESRCVDGRCAVPIYWDGIADPAHSEDECLKEGGRLSDATDVADGLILPGLSVCIFEGLTECPADWTQYSNYNRFSDLTCTGVNGVYTPFGGTMCAGTPNCTGSISNCTVVPWVNNDESTCLYNSCESTVTPGTVTCSSAFTECVPAGTAYTEEVFDEDGTVTGTQTAYTTDGFCLSYPTATGSTICSQTSKNAIACF